MDRQKNMVATITAWNFLKGFGFCQTANGKDYFIHIRNWREDDPPAVGRQICFEIAPPFSGGKSPMAVNVRFAPEVGADAGVNALASKAGAE